MYKAYRTKLKLNNKQRTLLAKHAGYSRWIWNWGLALWTEAYKQGLKPNAQKLKKLFTNHCKPQFDWMSNLSSRVYQYVFINLGQAFDRFFKKLGSYPKFKKKGRNDSFTLDNCGKLIQLGGCNQKLPFIGWLHTYEALPDCEVKKVTISKEADDWFIAFHVEHKPDAIEKPRTVVGVDLGINALATLSNGLVFENPKFLKSALRKVKRLQKVLSRKVKGGSNRNKTRLKLASSHQRVKNLRRDYLHKITTQLAKNHGEIVVEDLNVSGMLANHKLAAHIQDVGFHEFRRQLEYKCQWYGTKLTIADRFYPSSQLCSSCGHQQKMPLKERVYCCGQCSFVCDRDLNAAINLSNWGKRSPGSLLRDSRSDAPIEVGS